MDDARGALQGGGALGGGAEEALRLQRAQFQTLVNQAPLGVYMVDADFRLQHVNPVAKPVFGDIPGGVVGRDFDEIIHILWDKAYADSVVRSFRHTLETGESVITPERAEYRIDRGGVEYYSSRSDRITMPDGRYGVVCYFQDISEQAKAREAITASQAELHAELEHARLLQQISTALIQEDNSHRLYEKILDAVTQILRSDLAAIQILYPRANSKGDLKLLASRGLSEDARRLWNWVKIDSASACGEALRTGERVVVPDVETCDFMAGTGELDAFREHGIRALLSTPLRSRTGHILGMLSAHWNTPHAPSERELRSFDVLVRQAADLIDRSRSEVALRQVAERLRITMDTAGLGILEVDIHTASLTAFGKLKEQLGWPEAEPLTFEGLWGSIHPDDRARLERELAQAIEGSEQFTQEIRCTWPDGTVRWLLMRGGVVRPLDGEPTRFIAATLDVTERKLVEESLRIVAQSNRDLLDLVSSEWNESIVHHSDLVNDLVERAQRVHSLTNSLRELNIERRNRVRKARDAQKRAIDGTR